MRLKQSDLKPYKAKRRETTQEPDGTTSYDWSEESFTIQGNLQPAGGKVMAEMYGQRLAYMMTMLVEKGHEVVEEDGICLYKEEPDYKVVANRPWPSYDVLELEAIR